MPIYEFKCQECGKITEKMYSLLSLEKIIVCECGGIAHKILSRYSAPGTDKAWAGRGEVNFGVDTPKDEIRKQLAAASAAGHFDNGPARSERIRTGEQALKTACDVRIAENA